MKKSEFIIIVFFTLVASCNRPTKQTIYSLAWKTPTVLDTNYVINELNNSNSKKRIEGYYTQYNIIIDTSNVCYFYNNKTRLSDCCSSRDESDTPEFLNLDPYKMFVIPNEDLTKFLDANLRENSRGEIYLMVASPVDTIKQESFRIIAEYEKEHNKVSYSRTHNKLRYLKRQNIIYYVGIRLITEEEKNVMYCKKKNIQYQKEDFNWKTKFSNIIPKVTK